jgi:hypothetical protein
VEQRLAEKLAAVRNTEGTPPPKQQREDAEDLAPVNTAELQITQGQLPDINI